MSRSGRTSSQTTLPTRQVTCSVHQGRPCQACILCKQGNLSKYFHPKTWKNKALLDQLREFEPSLDIQLDSCICRRCRDDIDKLSQLGFIPRWRKQSKSHECCYVPGCNTPAQKVTKVVNKERLCDFLCIVDTDNTSPDNENGYPLCIRHYGELYRYIHPINKNCKTCNKTLDHTKSRKCPDPIFIQRFLLQNTDFAGEINIEDRICFACYKAHLVIIKHTSNTANSTDQDLSSLIDKLKTELEDEGEISTQDQAVLHAVHRSAILVGETLLEQYAILLPQVFDYFEKTYRDVTISQGMALQHGLHTSNWLLSQLSAALEQHMAYRCTVKRYGTVLYRYGGDLVHALNVSLGQSRTKTQPLKKGESDPQFQKNVSEVCLALNEKCHACTHKLIKENQGTLHTIENIDIEKCIDELDPDLWNAVCLITQPISSRAMTSVSGSHVRKMRRLFCACTLLFTTNSQCSFPLHTLITDAVETCGGSSRLLKLLNRLGVCTSADKHNRYVTERVKKQKEDGILSACPDSAFTVASTDNLDFLHSYARVYCGKQQLSWHGTTVQLVQPQPTNLADSPAPVIQVREIATCVESTRASDTYLSHNRHPDIPAMGSSETVLHTHLSKRPYSTLSPAKSPSRNTPLQKRRCIQSSTARSCRLTIADFQLTETETKVMDKLKQMSTDYILQKVASCEHNITVIDLQTYYSLSNDISSPECSNIIYFKVLDQRCDDKETLLNVISELHKECIVLKKKKYILLEGDQVTYERLQSIKKEYGNDLEWMLPFPGDWHLLKNYQEVLLKIYFDAGLSDLAKSSGYLPNSVGSNFKRTHHFLLEAWESLYRHFLTAFLKDQTPPDFLTYTAKWVKSFPISQNQQSTLRNLKEMLEDISDKHRNYHNCFTKYITDHAKQNETWKFWAQFVFQDCFAYISLYLSMRSGKWNLRMAAIKSMAALFSAFDRARYQKLVGQHIVDMLTFPDEVLNQLCHGGFTVSIKGRPCHSIGIDEAHEMCINRECKEYVTRPSAENLTRTAIFLPIRAKAMRNVEVQLFPEQNKACTSNITTIHTFDRESIKLEMNVKCQVEHLKDSNIVKAENNLCHLFKQKKPTPEQVNDLMRFRDTGQRDFETRVEYDILRNPSVKPPKRQKRLLTFTERKSRRKKVSDIEKERKLQVECWKKRIEFITKTGSQLPAFQQCIELPRAIATSDGQPIKGTKSNTTKVYEKRYEHACPPIINTSLPPGWNPETVIMEGMFLINITPWSAHKNIGEYAEFLLRQHVLMHYRNGATEVHLLFDDPECQTQSPKYFERLRRDQTNLISDDHCCTVFTADMVIPPKWRENILNCRKCKRNLVCFLSLYFTEKVKRKLRPQQKFVTAGGLEGSLRNQALFITSNGTPQRDIQLICNAEESDTRIWLHTINSYGQRKLILSPDTDVYHIGLPIVARTNLNVIVRLSSFSSVELRLLDMQALNSAFNNDPDLAAIPPLSVAPVMQALFVCTGCDFISFFTGLGKATFLNTFYEYCNFICSDSDQAPGILSNIDQGFLSFVRLVGCAYFKKHKSAFIPTYPTPMSLFNSLSKDDTTCITHHFTWLEFLRERIWSKIKYEEEMIPSNDALLRHWKRACWVIMVWSQSTHNNITYPPLEGNGWKQKCANSLAIDWDSEENMAHVREMVALIKKGCGCKTGCRSSRCKCKRGGNYCFGCKCVGCCNLPTTPNRTVTETQHDTEDEEDSEIESDEELEREVDSTMLEVFGDYYEPLSGSNSDNDSMCSIAMDI